MRVLTTEQVAKKLGMHRNSVIALIERGSLRAERFGCAWMIAPEDLQSFIAARRERWGKVKMHAGSPGRPPRKEAA